MKDMNKVILIGRLGTDPVLRKTQKGQVVVHFSMATQKKRKRGDESSQVETDKTVTDLTQWHQIVVWGKQGEHSHRYLRKGSTVLVEGEIRSQRYEAKDGQERRSFEVVAQEVGFLGSPLKRKNQPEPEQKTEVNWTVPA